MDALMVQREGNPGRSADLGGDVSIKAHFRLKGKD
jgi:hypothetical protein